VTVFLPTCTSRVTTITERQSVYRARADSRRKIMIGRGFRNVREQSNRWSWYCVALLARLESRQEEQEYEESLEKRPERLFMGEYMDYCHRL